MQVYDDHTSELYDEENLEKLYKNDLDLIGKITKKNVKAHEPGSIVTCKDGAEYIVDKNGAWRKLAKRQV